ncbi:DNA polymerase delta subunit 3-like [Linepithema humile]|uniref:DNA polymerase delta subunit 3-like n=1 Tax=Linepithema humile TaxID=83485 RepID=UPI00351DFD05
MVVEGLNEYLETLAGYVFDNDKLVTYKWLSKELQIHVNIAKQILWEFYQKYHKDNIECTHLLIGHLKDNGMRMEVVRDSALSKAKEKFSKLISEHLYSVHKPLGDLNLLASEFSGTGDINYSAIKCDACKVRSDEEMYLLRWGTATKTFTMQDVNSKPTDLINSSKSEKNSTKKNKFNNFFNMSGKSKNSEELKSSCQKEDESLAEKDKNFLKKKDSMKINSCSTEKNETLMDTIEGLTEEEKDSTKKKKDSVEEDKKFSKNKSFEEKIKNSKKKKEDSKVNSKKVSPKSNSVKKEGLDNFFKKLTSPPKPVEIVSSEENDKVKKTSTEKGKTKEKNNLRGRKRNRSKETNENAKKRKRVFVESDSSDSEAQSDVEMEESIPEPEPEPPAKAKSPSPPRIKHENGKRKVLKLVNRTYKEGDYIVTKKEHMYVSCSEDEEEKKEEERRRNVKKVEPKMEKIKKKQSTLTDFFKKS